jgi:hypothetical protein
MFSPVYTCVASISVHLSDIISLLTDRDDDDDHHIFVHSRSATSPSTNNDNDKTSALQDARRNVLSGTTAVNAMKGLRDPGLDWYRSSLSQMMIMWCITTSTAEDLDRCVAPNSTHATLTTDKKVIYRSISID